MIHIGSMNRLRVLREVDFGVYLEGDDIWGDILLPLRYVPADTAIGDVLDVFICFDSEDRIIATTEMPKAMVGDFAMLEVVAITAAGAFLDWGLPKDLLVPFGEQQVKMKQGQRYLVAVYQDEATGRIVASSRLDSFLFDVSEGDFDNGEAVSCIVAGKTPLGAKVIVNGTHWGLLHRQEQVRELDIGESVHGFIRQIRPDGKIDICLHRLPSEKTCNAADMILDYLAAHAGFLPLTDKSSPDDIRQQFGISKGQFKKAVGALYKRRKILLQDDGIRLRRIWPDRG